MSGRASQTKKRGGYETNPPDASKFPFPLLRSGADGNFDSWLIFATAFFLKKYGVIANVLKNLQPYVVPPVLAVDFMPAIAPAGIDAAGNVIPALADPDAEDVAKLRLRAEQDRNLTVSDIKKQWPGFYQDLMDACCEDSKIKIKASAGFEATDLSMNPNELVLMIADVHLGQFAGDQDLSELEKALAESDFEVLIQGETQSLAAFHVEFVAGVARWRASGLTPMPQSKQAVKFMTKLNSKNQAAFAHAVNTKTLPTTLSDAYILVSKWVDPKSVIQYKTGIDRAHLQAVLVTEPVPKKAAAPRMPRLVPSPTNIISKMRCDNCDGVGHPYYECTLPLPPGLLARKTRREEAQLASGRGNSNAGRGGRGGRSRGRGKEIATTGTALVVDPVGEENEDDDGIVFVIGNEPKCRSDDIAIVHLDSQSSHNIFSDISLLTGICERSTELSLSGINEHSPKLQVTSVGTLGCLGTVGISLHANANILSRSALKDIGLHIAYDDSIDMETVILPNGTRIDFTRRPGHLSRHYVCTMRDIEQALHADQSLAQSLVTTVAANLKHYSVRQVHAAEEARRVQINMANPSTPAIAELVARGASNTSLVPQDFHRADNISGPLIRSLKGKTIQRQAVVPNPPAAPPTVQQDQVAQVDLFYVKSLIFLHMLCNPLGLSLVANLKSKSAQHVGPKLKTMISTVNSRNFKIISILSDNEGAIAAIVPELNDLGIPVEFVPAGSHCPAIERRHRVIKERVRGYDATLPFTMTKLMVIFCVLFCVRAINMLASATSVSRVPPHEAFSGLRFDVKRDARFGFGDYVQVTERVTSNGMNTRTVGGLVMLPTGSSTGSIKILQLGNGIVVTRDLNAIKVLPMPTEVIEFINDCAAEDHMSRGGYDEPIGDSSNLNDLRIEEVAPLPAQVALGGGAVPAVHPGDLFQPAVGVPVIPLFQPELGVPDAPVHIPLQDDEQVADQYAEQDDVQEVQVPLPPPPPAPPSRGSRRQATDSLRTMGTGQVHQAMLTLADQQRAEARYQWALRSDWKDKGFAFKISAKAAIEQRGESARSVIVTELKQMVDKKVWHGVHRNQLTKAERGAMIRSSLFMKDKYFASGDFEKYKARLVAGGDRQNKLLYEDLSSPTVANTSLLTIAAIAAAEGRKVMVMDIGGAFLNADISLTGVIVHMRLDKLMTSILVEIDPSYAVFVEADGSSYVQLDKALYGTVEAAKLWYDQLSSRLVKYGFVKNPYDPCVFNKIGVLGNQLTVCFHVDDIFATAVDDLDLNNLEKYVKSVWKDITVKRGPIVDYLAMTFDFTTPGEVRITMDNIINNILSDCGIDTERATPATSALFDVRDVPKLSISDSAYYRTFVAKMLYLSKRVKPECLTAVAFLSTRVEVCDIDDLAKLHRLLGYLRASRYRGIVLRVGEHMTIRSYIDAAYGVHTVSGRSHTGCAIVVGSAGPVYVKSSKQKIVTKSSTEAELVAVSDTASQCIHLRNFVIAQGYEVGPAIIYQDNLSCMALMKKGGPCSDRSRHINIRHFWLKERVDGHEVIVEHLGTEKMFANLLTKPVQGAQFLRERRDLTNWE